MTRSDRVCRAVSLTLAVLCFLVVPQVAFAKFTSSKAPTLSASAARLVTPTTATGTYSCKTGYRTEGADVSVTGFTVTGQPAGVTYAYSLYRGTTLRDTDNTAAKTSTLSTGLQLVDSGNTTYRLTIVAKVGLWTATAYSRTFTCGGTNPTSGSL
jgi:hypothetical protein